MAYEEMIDERYINLACAVINQAVEDFNKDVKFLEKYKKKLKDVQEDDNGRKAYYEYRIRQYVGDLTQIARFFCTTQGSLYFDIADINQASVWERLISDYHTRSLLVENGISTRINRKIL